MLRHCDKGKLQYANGDHYEGGWSDGKREGAGCLSTSRGIFNGLFAKGYMVQGTYTDSRGNIYSSGEGGRFTKEGLLDGPGKIAFVNGDIFTGHFRDGKRSGPGKMVYFMTSSDSGEALGGTYEGQWKRDLREGQGRMQWDDGSSFEGLWKAGQRSKGVMVMSDGLIYEGPF